MNHTIFSNRSRKMMARKVITLAILVLAVSYVAGSSELHKPEQILAASQPTMEKQEQEALVAKAILPPQMSSEVLMSRGGSFRRTTQGALTGTFQDTTTPAETTVTEPAVVAPPPRVINTSSIASKSNLTGEEFNQVIANTLASKGYSNTKLQGIGDALARMEQTYNVNGLFCLAVAAYESGWGTSSAAYGRNNPFGLMSNGSIIRYNSMDSCIEYWGSLMRSRYFNSGRTTISSVSSKYCPPNASNWSSNVQYMFNAFAHEAKRITP